MKKYLSSYKLGDNPQRLFQMFSENIKVVYIPNACDIYTDESTRIQREKDDIQNLEAIGLVVKKIDLRDYFGKTNELKDEINNYGGIFVSGGNTFVLRQAYKLSGLDNLLIDYESNKPNFVYSGYSAGICILAQSLKGLDIVDDPNIYPYDDITQTTWEGLGVLNFSIAPHYNSNHPETKLVDELIQYCIKNKILFKALQDGEVLIYD